MNRIEYWAPVAKAWDRMKEILFRPFNLEKWMVMGFAAWLAGVSGGSGGSGGGNNFSQAADSSHSGACDAANMQEQFWVFWDEYGIFVLGISAVILVIILAISAFVTWLTSRGTFIFLDNVVNNCGRIAQPWRHYRPEANSLFLWRFTYGFICLFVLLFILALGIVSVWPLMQGEPAPLAFLAALLPALLLLILFSILTGYISFFLHQGVIPLMYKHQIGAIDGWRLFSTILKPHFWKFILYSLVLFLVQSVVGIAVLIAILATCCILGCFAAIPYIGTVLFLPVYVFYRQISLEFLRQFGPEFDLMELADPAPKAPEATETADGDFTKEEPMDRPGLDIPGSLE
jgi:hypothetical protein